MEVETIVQEVVTETRLQMNLLEQEGQQFKNNAFENLTVVAHTTACHSVASDITAEV